jgi:hypothetical protein
MIEVCLPVENFTICAILESRPTSEELYSAVLSLWKLQEIMSHGWEEVKVCAERKESDHPTKLHILPVSTIYKKCGQTCSKRRKQNQTL